MQDTPNWSKSGANAMLQEHEAHTAHSEGAAHVFFVGSCNSPVTYTQVRHILELRKSRRKFFPPALFADPVWDILLHLYATELAGQRSSVTQVVRGSNVPEATTIRWIGQLIDVGLCRKIPDPSDRRRIFVSLTATGMQAMDAYFTSVQTHGGGERLSLAA